MKFDLNQAIEVFQKATQKIFEFYKSFEITFGTQKLSMFDILLFFMIFSVIWYFLTGSRGDDD